MAAAHAACPQHVPALLLFDPAASVLVQEFISDPQQCRVKLVDALALRGAGEGNPGASPPPPPRLAADLASLLGGYLLRNSVYELSYEECSSAAARMENAEVVRANTGVVFTDPWDTDCPRNRVPPGLEEEVAELRSNTAVRREVARLLDLYLTSRETLIHNDLTSGNILVPAAGLAAEVGEATDRCFGAKGRAAEERGTAAGDAQSGAVQAAGTAAKAVTAEVDSGRQMGAGGGESSGGNGCSSSSDGGGGGRSSRSETHLIDWEFATYGPLAYDVGSLLGNLLLSYCATCGLEQDERQASERPCSGVMASSPPPSILAATVAVAGPTTMATAATAAPQLRAPLLECICEVWDGLEARLSSCNAADDAAAGIPGGAPAAAGTRGGNRKRGIAGGDASRDNGGGDSGQGLVDDGGVGGAGRRFDEAFVQQLLADSLGYAGCVMTRLVMGMHHYPALAAISCGRRRASCQLLVLRLAAALLSPADRSSRRWVAAGGSAGGGGGVRQLVRDVELWAADTAWPR